MRENCLSTLWKDGIICKNRFLELKIGKNTVITPEKSKLLGINAQNKKVVLGKSKLCNGKGVFSKEPIYGGDRIIKLTGKIISESNEYALQIDEKKFMGTSGNLDDFIDHSCKPNCFIKFDNDGIFLVALRDIDIGEEVSFDYHTTEFDLGKDSFVCNCNSENCIGIVRGFRHLAAKEKNKLKPFLSPFLQAKL